MNTIELTRNQSFLISMAQSSAGYSTCSRHQVGAVLSIDNTFIVSSGRNGVKSGEPHCCDLMNSGKLKYKDHRDWSKKNEIHAEVNALQLAFEKKLINSANHTEQFSLYVTHSPCCDCTDFIISSRKMFNISEVYFVDTWFNERELYIRNLEKFAAAGISVFKIVGMRTAFKLVDGETNKVLNANTNL